MLSDDNNNCTFPSSDISHNDIQLLDRIGSGATGVVFKAELKSKNMLVAVKKIPISFGVAEDFKTINKEVR
mgnify:FL=1